MTKKKPSSTVVVILTLILLVICVFVGLHIYDEYPKYRAYHEGLDLMEEGEYQEAYNIFWDLTHQGFYRDSFELSAVCGAHVALENGNPIGARGELNSLRTIFDREDLIDPDFEEEVDTALAVYLNSQYTYESKPSSTSSETTSTTRSTSTSGSTSSYGQGSYSEGYDDVYMNEDYDRERYRNDIDYANGVEDGIDDWEEEEGEEW